MVYLHMQLALYLTSWRLNDVVRLKMLRTTGHWLVTQLTKTMLALLVAPMNKNMLVFILWLVTQLTKSMLVGHTTD